MPIERMHTPKYWRTRAEEFRAKADSCAQRQTKEALRKVADSYEQLARCAERIRTVEDAAE
jgi:hypothetical protein